MWKFSGPENQLFIWRAGVRKNQGWEFITQWPAPAIEVGLGDLSDLGDRGVGYGYTGGEGFLGALWSKVEGISYVFDVPGGKSACAFSSCDALGLAAAGYATPGKFNAAYYTPRHGLTALGTLVLEHSGSVFNGDGGGSSMDSSGHVAVGVSGISSNIAEWTAIVWNTRDGMRSIEDLLVSDYGLTQVVPWQLMKTMAISPNGRFIAGQGINPQGKFETWWAEVRPFCYADCDNASTPKGGEAVLNVDDFICYVTHFVLDDLYANCNNDAELDINDFICFQTKFVLGCP